MKPKPHGAATVLPYQNYQASKLQFTIYYALLTDCLLAVFQVISESGQINPSEKLQKFRGNNSYSSYFSLIY